MTKILFRHPELRNYRRPFFDLIDNEYQLTFLLNKKPNEGFFYNYEIIGTEKHRSRWLDLRATTVFFRMLMFSSYDVFVASLPSSSTTVIGLIVAKLRNKKVVLWDEGWCLNEKDCKFGVREIMTKFIYKYANALFVTSSRTFRYVESKIKKNYDKIFFACQCNIDLSIFKPVPINFPVPDNYIKILYFSRVIELKGLDILIKAFHAAQVKNHDKISLLIAGDGDFLEECQSIVKRLGLKHCYFLGSLPDNANEKKAYLFSVCDIFVLPSRIIGRQMEAWGLVVGEAMSMGKPVIVSDAVGCVDDLVIDGVNGYIVEHSSVESLAKAINMISCDREKLLNMGIKSRQIFEEKISYQKKYQMFERSIKYALKN